MRPYTGLYPSEEPTEPSKMLVLHILRGAAYAWLVYGLVSGSIYRSLLDLMMTSAAHWPGLLSWFDRLCGGC